MEPRRALRTGRPSHARAASRTGGSIDWREPPALARPSAGRPSTRSQLGLGGRRWCSCTGSPGAGRTGSSSSAAFAPEHRVIALDLPGLRPLAGTRRRSLDARLRPHARRRCSHELGLDRATIVGNSMGGLIAAELAASYPARVERLVLVSPAGLATYRNRLTTRAMPAIRRVPAAARAGRVLDRLPRRRASPRGRALRELVLKGVVAHPGRLPGPLAAEQLRGAGTDGFLPALEAILEFDLQRAAAPDPCPTLIVWGDQRPADQRSRRRPLRRGDPRGPQGGLRGHRPHGDARAPARVQRAAARVPGERGRRAATLSARPRPRRRCRPASRTSGSPRRCARRRAAGARRRRPARRSPRR